MDCMQFIASIVESLAWPSASVAIVAILLFRLPDIRKAIQSVRYKDFEINMRQDFEKARDAAEEIVGEIGEQAEIDQDAQDRIIRLSNIDPSLAIIEIWRNLEAEIVALMQHNGLIRFTNPVKFMEQLASMGKIGSSEIELFRRLREIRNLSVHSPNNTKLTLSEVLEFKTFSDLLTAKFEKIKDEPGYIDPPN